MTRQIAERALQSRQPPRQTGRCDQAIITWFGWRLTVERQVACFPSVKEDDAWLRFWCDFGFSFWCEKALARIKQRKVRAGLSFRALHRS